MTDDVRVTCPACKERFTIYDANDIVLLWQDWQDATERVAELEEWYSEEKSRHAACAKAAQELEDAFSVAVNTIAQLKGEIG